MTVEYCTAIAPMPKEDSKNFYWVHEDAVETGVFFNMVLYTCPHCGFTFHAPPRRAS